MVHKLTVEEIDKIRENYMGGGPCEWTEELCKKNRKYFILYRKPTPGVANPFTTNVAGVETTIWRELSDVGIPMRVCPQHEGASATRLGYGNKAKKVMTSIVL